MVPTEMATISFPSLDPDSIDALRHHFSCSSVPGKN
jgi:hypothetical protein